MAWHPAINEVVSDVTRSCIHCQKIKVAAAVQPPVTKIVTSFPFELVAIDLMQMPKARGGFCYLLVVIDHNSKWTVAVPLSCKSSGAVVSALKNRVLPILPGLPRRVLSDNGQEFNARDVGELLAEYGIKQVFTTPYKPSSNGLVERMNRTLLELLRSLSAKGGGWIDEIQRAVMIYNHSYHSSLGMSPATYLLTKSHDINERPIAPIDEVAQWRDGNPAFCSFRQGNLVLRKKIFKGNRVEDKLSERFEGPFKILVRHPNGVTYLIRHCETGVQQRAHHTQLRRFYTPPKYILEHPAYSRIVEGVFRGGDSDRDEPSGGHVVEDDVVDDFERNIDNEFWSKEMRVKNYDSLYWGNFSDGDSDSDSSGSSDDISEGEAFESTGSSASLDERGNKGISNCVWSHHLSRICDNERALVITSSRNNSQTTDSSPTWSLVEENSEFWIYESSSEGGVGNCSGEMSLAIGAASGSESVISSSSDCELNFAAREVSEVMVTPPPDLGLSPYEEIKINVHTYLDGSLDEKANLLLAKQRAARAVWLSADLEALDLACFYPKDVSVSRALGELTHRRVKLARDLKLNYSCRRSGRLEAIHTELKGLYPYRQEAEGAKLVMADSSNYNLVSDGLNVRNGETRGSGAGAAGRKVVEPTHGICTRSKGPVPPLPNVQKVTLEYKERVKK